MIDEHRVKVMKVSMELEQKKIQRAVDILEYLRKRGYKKIGKTQINAMLENHSVIKFDHVIDFYENLMKKDKE